MARQEKKRASVFRCTDTRMTGGGKRGEKVKWIPERARRGERRRWLGRKGCEGVRAEGAKREGAGRERDAGVARQPP